MRPWREGLRRALLDLEICAALQGARLALALFGFKGLTGFLDRQAKSPERRGEARHRTVHAIRQALGRSRGSWRDHGVRCLHRAIAAQMMLRRRHVTVSLCYGAMTRPGEGFRAHAWVMDGEEGVVGHIVARQDGYPLLAWFPRNLRPSGGANSSPHPEGPRWE